MYQPISPKLLKEKIGQPLWVIPLHNAVRRGTPLREQIRSAEIEKVGTKMVTLKSIGKANLDGTINSYNSGYLCFLSEQEAHDYLDCEEFIKDLKYNINFHKISIEKIKEIKKIINS